MSILRTLFKMDFFDGIVSGMKKVPPRYYFYVLFLVFTLLDFATFLSMDKSKETNPVWVLFMEGQYLEFSAIYFGLFLGVVIMTEYLLSHPAKKHPLIGFFAYSLIVFGCQAHLLGALTNIDTQLIVNAMEKIGIDQTKVVDYPIFLIFFISPIPLSLVAFKGWQDHIIEPSA